MRKIVISSLALLITACFVSCNFTKKQQNTISDAEKYHAAYDDSTLNRNVLPVMMPYNRIIDPAGKVVSFGSNDVENHSLDVQQIFGTSQFAIEDRYGIAILDTNTNKIVARLSSVGNESLGRRGMSTYSGIQVVPNGTHYSIFWSASNSKKGFVFQADWNGKQLNMVDVFDFRPDKNIPSPLPNELALKTKNDTLYMYVVLNGNNTVQKINTQTKQVVWTSPVGVAPYGIAISGNYAYVTNWGGTMPKDSTRQEAGVPYGKAFVDPRTGAIDNGTVSVLDLNDGKVVKEIKVGLHPNDIVASTDEKYIYVSNGNSDNVSVISTQSLDAVGTISVKILADHPNLIGDSPNALALSPDNSTLYVANGMDNAIAVVKLHHDGRKSMVEGFIPTEAYPGGIFADAHRLVITNLEGEGSRINSKEINDFDSDESFVKNAKHGAYNSHHEKATISTIALPDSATLVDYTAKTKSLMMQFRVNLAKLAPRSNQPARPMPERVGEPSIFKHVIYIIKENRTYDQVLGDMKEGNGAPDLCIYGDSVTPNQHQLAKQFVLLDNYYASGKCSAEGHQWTDAGMVTDYVEKNVRAWFRSYPHVQTDALVYDSEGFIWNHAADHGKSVRIYGEACTIHFNEGMSWLPIYDDFVNGKKFEFHNTTTIERVKDFLSPNYPGYDSHNVPDVVRADAFIKELKTYENMPGDQWPELMVMALPADHTGGTRPGLPTPRAMVADNDLALARIVEAVSKSRFWKNTVIFVTEDDSQAGWDHVSAYRTTGFVISPYSQTGKVVNTNYNQTCMLRSIEQILGIPPMNIMDATATPMFACFTDKFNAKAYTPIPNKIPLNEMNPQFSELKGKALHYAKVSSLPEYAKLDGGNDDMLNRILWFSAKGNQTYPAKLAGHDGDDD